MAIKRRINDTDGRSALREWVNSLQADASLPRPVLATAVRFALEELASQAEGNALQVRMELQADCYAGVWAARAKTSAGQPVMEPGDMEEAMRAANAIGDDTLMRSAGQRPVPEAFTHGTSAQRMEWLRRGLQTGDPRQCNTFQGA